MFALDEEKRPTEEEEHDVFTPVEEKKPAEEEGRGVFAPDEPSGRRALSRKERGCISPLSCVVVVVW